MTDPAVPSRSDEVLKELVDDVLSRSRVYATSTEVQLAQGVRDLLTARDAQDKRITTSFGICQRALGVDEVGDDPDDLEYAVGELSKCRAAAEARVQQLEQERDHWHAHYDAAQSNWDECVSRLTQAEALLAESKRLHRETSEKLVRASEREAVAPDKAGMLVEDAKEAEALLADLRTLPRYRLDQSPFPILTRSLEGDWLMSADLDARLNRKASQ